MELECNGLEKFVVNGGKPLFGEVNISGAKNAAVAIIPAVILCDEPCQIENIPNISDVSLISRILQQMGAQVRRINKSSLYIDPTHISTHSVLSTVTLRAEAVQLTVRFTSYLLKQLLFRHLQVYLQTQENLVLPQKLNFPRISSLMIIWLLLLLLLRKWTMLKS